MDKKAPEKSGKSDKLTKINYTHEATSFLAGLFHEFNEQKHKYVNLTAQLLAVEAQIELAEKTLCLTRDHFAVTIEKTEGALPNNWEKVFRSVRFVGVRLVDACKTVLQDKKKLTPEQMLDELNEGLFRFRTNSPLREIHAALLRQSFVKKVGPAYLWIGENEQMPLRMPVLKTKVIDQTPIKEGTMNSQAKTG